jgi:hypothetical protein
VTRASRPTRRRVRLRTRIIATAAELVPLVPVALLPGTSNGEGPILYVLALASGLGWLVLGRWTTAVATWLIRFFVLGGLLFAAAIYGLSIGDCSGCSQTGANIVGGALLALYVGWTLVSAFFVARAEQAS